MELNKIANGKFNERMEHKLKLAAGPSPRAVGLPGQHHHDSASRPGLGHAGIVAVSRCRSLFLTCCMQELWHSVFGID